MSIVPNAICIPRIEASIPKSLIVNTFLNLKIGEIDGVIEIPFKDASRYKRIIVKIRWNDSDQARFILTRFQDGKNVKIVYNSSLPWFWICVPNRLHCKIGAHAEISRVLPVSNTREQPG
jgi:hypothetical protein